jgi:hypothetical protein
MKSIGIMKYARNGAAAVNFLLILFSGLLTPLWGQNTIAENSRLPTLPLGPIIAKRTTKKIINQIKEKVRSSIKTVNHDFYSTMRMDSPGNTIHDMMLAHAYTYMLQNEEKKKWKRTWRGDQTQNTFTYAGACVPQKSQMSVGVKNMLYSVGLNSALRVRCPDQNPNSKATPVLLNDKLYRWTDSKLFTDDWIENFISQSDITDMNSEYINPLRKKRLGHRPKKHLKMIVHMERGIVDPCNWPSKYLTNDHYMRLIEEYSPSNATVSVTIYTDVDTTEPMDLFLARNYTVKRIPPLLGPAWRDMMIADIFIMSRSAFSLVPALFNPNQIIYTPFKHSKPPTKNWISVPQKYVEQSDKKRQMLCTDKKKKVESLAASGASRS